MSGSLPAPWVLLPLRGSHRAVLRRKSHYAVGRSSLMRRLLSGSYRPAAARILRIVSAFAAAVASCHRFVPDEMSIQFFGGAFLAQFSLDRLRLEVPDLFPCLPIRAVVVVLVRVIQLDRVSEPEDSLLQSDPYILGVLVHRFRDLDDRNISSGKGRKFQIDLFLCHLLHLLSQNMYFQFAF